LLAATAHIVVTASNNWHPGIVGLLASRLRTMRAGRPSPSPQRQWRRHRPGRSVSGDRPAGARACRADQGGGHAMAAGITVERAKLGELRAFFEQRAAAEVFRLQDEESLAIDGALAAEGATLGLLDGLEKAGP
jgi:single-stranded-DNA-specific exonuclease